MATKIIASIILLAIGILFIANNKNISKGAFTFYRTIYTKKNLKMMFKAAGIILIVGGIILLVIR